MLVDVLTTMTSIFCCVSSSLLMETGTEKKIELSGSVLTSLLAMSSFLFILYSYFYQSLHFSFFSFFLFLSQILVLMSVMVESH